MRSRGVVLGSESCQCVPVNRATDGPHPDGHALTPKTKQSDSNTLRQLNILAESIHHLHLPHPPVPVQLTPSRQRRPHRRHLRCRPDRLVAAGLLVVHAKPDLLQVLRVASSASSAYYSRPQHRSLPHTPSKRSRLQALAIALTGSALTMTAKKPIAIGGDGAGPKT
jgi:hypothetical protein